MAMDGAPELVEIAKAGARRISMATSTLTSAMRVLGAGAADSAEHRHYGRRAGAPRSVGAARSADRRRRTRTPTAAQPVGESSAAAIENLQFRYRIEGDAAPWRPVRAFDDGQQVFIEFPAGIGQGEMPPLWIVGAEGRAELVNYRVRGHHMIVDRLFAGAELRLGGTHQQRVRIVRTDGVRSGPLQRMRGSGRASQATNARSDSEGPAS